MKEPVHRQFIYNLTTSANYLFSKNLSRVTKNVSKISVINILYRTLISNWVHPECKCFFHDTTKGAQATILRWWLDAMYCVSMYIYTYIYPSPSRIALKVHTNLNMGCCSSKPPGIYPAPFQSRFEFFLPHCCFQRFTLLAIALAGTQCYNR